MIGCCDAEVCSRDKGKCQHGLSGEDIDVLSCDCIDSGTQELDLKQYADEKTRI